MGLSFAMLTLRNPRYPDLPPVEVEALADTGSVFLCLPAEVAEALRLETAEHREATIADGSRRRVPYVGPVQVHFKNRSAFVGALVMGERVLLGAIPMEDMDLVVSPLNRKVDVNPASPDVASCIVMASTAADWEALAVESLARAYGPNEPDYSLDDIKRPL